MRGASCLLVALSCAGCLYPLHTRRALITARNETAQSLQLGVRLRGNGRFHDEGPVAAGEVHDICEYEEPLFSATPAEHYVIGLQLRTGEGCVVTLDGPALNRTAQRDREARRWTFPLTAQLLAANGCPR